jgi:ribonucleotide monophosphatase NagD (HAD superfamily)
MALVVCFAVSLMIRSADETGFSAARVRGYMNLLFERSITERFRDADITGAIANDAICCLIVLVGTQGRVDMPKLTEATAYFRDGASIVFTGADATVESQPDG